MGSGQPSHEGFREEINWAFRVSDPTSALFGGALSAPFKGVGPMGTHFSASAPPAQHPVLSLLRECGAADSAFHCNAGGSGASRGRRQ